MPQNSNTTNNKAHSLFRYLFLNTILRLIEAGIFEETVNSKAAIEKLQDERGVFCSVQKVRKCNQKGWKHIKTPQIYMSL